MPVPRTRSVNACEDALLYPTQLAFFPWLHPRPLTRKWNAVTYLILKNPYNNNAMQGEIISIFFLLGALK